MGRRKLRVGCQKFFRKGRKYTCYRSDGSCKSRIGHFLVNSEWLSRWPSSFQKGLQRTVSDHCPLILESKAVNWVPKPFRFIDAWISQPNFKTFVEDVCKSYEIDGWGGFVLKEKLKWLKNDLKQWNKDTFRILESKISSLKNYIQELDILDDTFGLDEAEIIKRKTTTAELFRSLNKRNCLYSHKAMIRWLSEGDLNSSFFHRAINFRRKTNEISGTQIDGVWREEVDEVKESVFNHFKRHFSSSGERRSKMVANTSDKCVSEEYNSMLTEPFSEQEVKNSIKPKRF